MAWFNGGRAPASRFPSDMIARLERWGHFEALPDQGTGTDGYTEAISAISYGLGNGYLDWVMNDFPGFCAELQKLMAGQPSGWATLGAAGVVWELGTEAKIRACRAAVSLVLAGIEFKRARGIPLTPPEMRIATTGQPW